MIFRFFGSIYFAIILIAFTLLFVIAGTFLESWTESHLFAAHLTYHNPLFQILLWLYFINILFAALSRWPFKKKHIPFLLTHLGLLMLLAGVFVKNHFGVQGVMGIAEGSGSDALFLPHTYAIHLESPSIQTFLPLKKGQVGPLKNEHGLELTILEWIPHAQERYEGFFKGNWVHILGYPPIEVTPVGSAPSLKTEEYAIYAHQKVEPNAITFPAHQSLFFIQDPDKKEHLIAFAADGTRFSDSLENEAFYIFNKGYGGYAVFAQLPQHFSATELIAPLTRVSTPQKPPHKQEELTPRIRLLVSDGTHTEVVNSTFDQYGLKFKWPILAGKYLVRFQAMRKKIPYHVRLQTARQINYPETNHPYSFESKIVINDEEATLSMNHVYEKNGFRFYLANLLSKPERANQVQIVVNHDPAKYWLTYPGAIILALGIALLYLRKHYV